jgi:hypothetical protein
MKKGEIKRRKRVIPAWHSSTPGHQQLPHGGYEYHGVAPLQAASGAVQSLLNTTHQVDPSRTLPPPPVDFTNYRTTSPASYPSPPRRKRTYSEANGLPYTSQANGNSLPPSERIAETPTLPASAPEAAEGESSRGGASLDQLISIDPHLRSTLTSETDIKTKDRETLRREAERMRAQLQALEARLASMNKD